MPNSFRSCTNKVFLQCEVSCEFSDSLFRKMIFSRILWDIRNHGCLDVFLNVSEAAAHGCRTQRIPHKDTRSCAIGHEFRSGF